MSENRDDKQVFEILSELKKIIEQNKSNLQNGNSVSFNVNIPNGDYDVNLVIRSVEKVSSLTLAVNEAFKLLAFKLSDGEVQNKNFAVSVVHEKLNFEFSGNGYKIEDIGIVKMPLREASEYPSIFIAGDSTVQSYKPTDAPITGWGQMIERFFKEQIKVVNHAFAGRSSKRFITDGRLDRILTEIKPNDYLLVQWGHNDNSDKPERYTEPNTTFKQYLRWYIDGARQRKAVPVLVTPMGQRNYDKDGKIEKNLVPYVKAMKEVAEEQEVPLIDLNTKSIEYFDSIGEEGTKSVFLWFEAGLCLNYPNGSNDSAHFQGYGAYQMARLVVEEIKTKVQGLSKFLLEASEVQPAPAVISKDTLPKVNFEDIKGSFAENEIQQMVRMGIMSGMNEKTFEPNGLTSRAEFIVLLTRLLKIPAVPYKDAFKDIKEDQAEQWYAGAVQAAFDKGLINDEIIEDENLKPDMLINEEEMISLTISAYRFKVKDEIIIDNYDSYCNNLEVSSWAKNNIVVAKKLGILDEKLKFEAKQNVNRALAAFTVSKLLDKTQKHK